VAPGIFPRIRALVKRFKTAPGYTPIAFGIPRGISGSQYWTYGNKQPRVYLGWRNPTKDSVANPTNIRWTRKFFQAYVGDTYTRPVVAALALADQAEPDGATPGLVYVGSANVTRGRLNHEGVLLHYVSVVILGLLRRKSSVSNGTIGADSGKIL
jgi:hypothetical protein